MRVLGSTVFCSIEKQTELTDLTYINVIMHMNKTKPDKSTQHSFVTNVKCELRRFEAMAIKGTNCAALIS